jgi:TP901 family phage tail tape measure protein
MADERIVTSIVANSDFSNLIADVQRVSSSLFKLQQEFAGANRALAGQIGAANAMFNQNMLKTGQFSSHFVSLTSDVEKFGKNLDGGRLKLKDYFRVYQENVRTSGGLIRDLAKQQVQLQNAVLQPLGKNAQGLMQYNVHIPRGLDVTKNKTALLKQELQIMNKVIQDGGVQLINWGKNTQWAGRQLTVGLTLPLVAFGKAAADAFKVADQELTRLTKVYGDVAGTSAQELAKVRKEVSATAKELSAAMGVNFSETIGLAADIAATGKTGNELLSSVSETTRLAVLGEVDRQEAMKATLAIQSAFKSNTQELAETINFLNAVENQTSTTLNDLVEAIPKAGPVIKGLGGDVQDLALYMTAMREGGINASEGANALKSALASLINPTDVAVKKFQGFGIDLLGIVSKNAGDTTATLFALQAALDRLDPLQKQQAIEQLFGKFQFSRLNALFENLGRQGSQTLQVLDLMKASAGELEAVAGRELAAVTESAAGRYKRAVETLKAELASTGDSFLNIATKLVNVLNKVLEFGSKLPDPIKKLMTFAGAFTAIIGPVIMLTGVLANFFGYIIKGLGHFKALFKGAEGFQLLTPEIIAAKNASSMLSDEFYSDAKAADTLSLAIRRLSEDLKGLQLNAANATSTTNSLGATIATAAGTPIMTVGGALGAPRISDPNHPLIGPQSRAAAHLNPRDPNNPSSIFGLTLQPVPVNRRIGATPQILMSERLPDVPGLTTMSGVSTGVVAAEHAKFAALMATLGVQSQQEIDALKKTIGLGGQVSRELLDTFDDILPITQRLTANAAAQSASIVAELRAGTINVQQARAQIIAVNAQLEALMGAEISAYAAGRGRTIDLTKAPLINQPVVDVAGKPNIRGAYRGGIFLDVMESLGRATGTKTFGGPYSIETTRPIGRNRGGSVPGYINGEYVYMTNGETVPGPNVNADIVPAMLTPGEFVLTRDVVQQQGSDAVEALHRGQAAIVPFGANMGGQVPGYRFGRFVRPASSRSATSSRTRDIAVSGGYGNYSWQTRNSRVGSEIDEYINSLSSPQDKAKAALIIQDFAGRVTTSSSNPLGRSRYPGVIQPSHIAREGIGLSAILQANGLPALIQKARTHQTHLTRASVSGGRRYVSRYVVDFDAMSNLQANAGTLKVADFIARNMGRKNKYNTLFKQSGLPKEKWQFTENQIDESISAMLSGKGDKLIGDNIGDIIFERDFVPIIDQIMINNGASPSQITAIKRNTILRRNRGGRVPGYNRGGRVARNQNRAGGTVRSGRRFYGDFHPTLASQMGLTPTPGFTPMPVGGQQISQASPSRGMLGMMGFQAASFGGMYAGQSLGSRFGSGGAMAGSIIGSMLPMMMMGGMGGRGLGKGTEEAYNFYGNKLDKSLAGNTKFATSLANNAAQGSKFSKVLMTMVGGLTKLNLVLAGVTLAVGAGIKIFENYKKTQELSAAEFGMTSEAAEKAGLKFTDYSKKIKDAVEAQKLLIAQNKINYQNMASAGTPFKMTITEYNKLRKEIKETMSAQIEMINAIQSKDVTRVATQLKTQFISMGLSAEEAAKRVYTLLQMSDKAYLTVSVMSSKTFGEVVNAQTAAISALKAFDFAKQFENTKDQAAALNTALMAIDGGIKEIYDKAEKAAAKKKQDFDSTKAQYNAEKTQLDAINSKVQNQKAIGDLVLNNLAKQNPLIRQFATAQDTVVSLWQKMRIAARGYTGDLNELNVQQTQRLYDAQIAISQAVEKSTKTGILKKQYDEYKRLYGIQKDLEKAAKGQSVKEQINARDAIRAIDKKIKKINEEADARKKALQEEAQAEDIALRIKQKRLEYEKMVSAGDFGGAAEAQIELRRLQNEQQLTLTEQQIEERRLKDVGPLERQKERLEKNQEKLADKAAMAAESLESVTKKADAQKKKIDEVNIALTSLLIAKATGEGIKGAAATFIKALEDSGAVLDKTKYVEGGKPTNLSPVEIANQFLKDAKFDVGEILAEKDIVITANGDIIIDGVNLKDNTSGPRYTRDNPDIVAPGKYETHTEGDKKGRLTTSGSTQLVKDKGYVEKEFFMYNGVLYKVQNVKSRTGFDLGLGAVAQKADGGEISGPGTGTSDSIPIMASDGEYVVRAAAVEHYGVDTMEAINAKRFKDGGLVSKSKYGDTANLDGEVFRINNGTPEQILADIKAAYAAEPKKKQFKNTIDYNQAMEEWNKIYSFVTPPIKSYPAEGKEYPMGSLQRFLAVANSQAKGGDYNKWLKADLTSHAFKAFSPMDRSYSLEDFLDLESPKEVFDYLSTVHNLNKYSLDTNKQYQLGSDLIRWCGAFVAWVAKNSGVNISKNMFSGYKAVEEYKKLGQFNETGGLKPGDIVWWDYAKRFAEGSEGAKEYTPGIADHVDIVNRINKSGIETIGGGFDAGVGRRSLNFKQIQRDLYGSVTPEFQSFKDGGLVRPTLGTPDPNQSFINKLLFGTKYVGGNMKMLKGELPFGPGSVGKAAASFATKFKDFDIKFTPGTVPSADSVVGYFNNAPVLLKNYFDTIKSGAKWPNLTEHPAYEAGGSLNALRAYVTGSNKPVGELSWDPFSGTVLSLNVDSAFRRKGLASKFWEIASGLGPISHSAVRSLEGDDWARAVGGNLPDLQHLVPKMAGGGYINPTYSANMSMPSYYTGAKYIYDDTIAKLHKGEMVVPSGMNPNNPFATNAGGGISINMPLTVNAAPGMDEDYLINKAAIKVQKAMETALTKVGTERNITRRYQ